MVNGKYFVRYGDLIRSEQSALEDAEMISRLKPEMKEVNFII